eukprot:5481872-Pyramimonas_sp.AAC.1
MHRQGGQPTKGGVDVGLGERDALARALRRAPGRATQRVDGPPGAKLVACRGAPVHLLASG